jgi:uncharacterized membrane protein
MTRKIFVFELVLIAAALAATVILYPQLPVQVPTHWGSQLSPDNYGPKWQLYLFGPGGLAAILALTWLLPWLSPRRFEMEAFKATYGLVMLLVFLLVAYIYAVMLWAACGHAVQAVRAIFCGACLFMALFGNQMGKLRRNFYVGVRTPWTLASERVWNRTHRFAGKAMVAAGLLGMLLSVAGPYLWAAAALGAAALASVAYSLVFYKQLERRGEL